MGRICASIVFSLAFFDCWMARVGRWRCQMIFGPPAVASIMQLLEDGERLRIGARIHDLSPRIVSRLWIS